MTFQLTAFVLAIQVIQEPLIVFRLLKADAMECLLKVNWILLLPDGGATGVSTLTNQHITFDRRVFLILFREKWHLKNIREIKGKPANVEVPQVRLQVTFVFLFVEHFPERVHRNLFDWLDLPSFAALGEDGLEVAFEEGAGVLAVLLSGGAGGGDAGKGFVEDGDDALLFLEGRKY